MKVLEIDIKTVSPMFSSRGDKKFVLLPQSIRGVMHFWFRACAPRVIDVGENYASLKHLEEYIFGSTELKSPFDLIISNDYKGNISSNKKYLDSFSYILYGVNENEYLKPDTKITLKFVIKRNIKDLEYLLFNLMSLIERYSGFGAKSRKGFGSFEIISAKLNGSNFEDKYPELKRLKKLDKLLLMMVEDFNNQNKDLKINLNTNKSNENKIPDFPILRKGDYKLFNSKRKDFNSVEELLQTLYFSSRNNYGLYIKLKKESLRGKGTKNDTYERALNREKNIEFKQALLGLPINYKDKDRYRGRNSLKGADRKASPLFISIHKNKNNYFYRVLIIKSKMNFDGNELAFGKNKNEDKNGYFSFGTNFEEISKDLIDSGFVEKR